MLSYAGLKSPASCDENIISIIFWRPKRFVWMDCWIYYLKNNSIMSIMFLFYNFHVEKTRCRMMVVCNSCFSFKECKMPTQISEEILSEEKLAIAVLKKKIVSSRTNRDTVLSIELEIISMKIITEHWKSSYTWSCNNTRAEIMK